MKPVSNSPAHEQSERRVPPLEPHMSTDDPLVKCRCGCVPKDMMSLFQMAELRAKMREEKRRKEAEQSAQNLPTGRM